MINDAREGIREDTMRSGSSGEEGVAEGLKLGEVFVVFLSFGSGKHS